MNKLFLIFVFALFTGFAFAQTPNNKAVPQNQTQAGEKSKSIGVSSAARKSSLNKVPPVAGQKKSDNRPDGTKPNPGSNNGEMKGSKPGSPNMHNRPNVRVPQARPNSPIIRPNGLPGNRPSMPKHRPPGGG
ncbi:MAG: hypothetical protein PSV36_04690 [Algoriphagus sp.]|nr:hypothetical protein [Algoriphagus sp.]